MRQRTNLLVKTSWLAWLILSLLSSTLQAQIRIGAPSSESLNPGAALEIKSGPYPDNSFKGLLLPKVALINYATWSLAGTPEDGMLVFNTAIITGSYAVTPGIYCWYNFQWNRQSPTTVSQAIISAIDCQPNVPASGLYYTSRPLTASNTKQILVTPGSAGPYYITTYYANGFSFVAQGSFTANQVGTPQSITLTGSGTPSSAGTASYTVTAGTQSCTFNLTVTNTFDCSGPLTGDFKVGKQVDSTLTKQITYTAAEAGTYTFTSTFYSVNHDNFYSFTFSSSPLVISPAQVGIPQPVILYGSSGKLPLIAGSYTNGIVVSNGAGSFGSGCSITITVHP